MAGGAATAATECPDPMLGGPRRFSWAHGKTADMGAAMKPELHGIPIDRAKACVFDADLFDQRETARLRCGPHALAEAKNLWGAEWGPGAVLRDAQRACNADYSARIRDGRLAVFGQFGSPRGEWTWIKPEEVRILFRKNGRWQDRSGDFVVWSVHVHDTIGVPLRLARALYGSGDLGVGPLSTIPCQDDQAWLEGERTAGRLVCDGDLVRQPPPLLPDWPGAEAPAAVAPIAAGLASPDSDLKPRQRGRKAYEFWPSLHSYILDYIDREGPPAMGKGLDGGLEKLIEVAAAWLDERGHSAAKSTIQEHVKQCVAEYRANPSVMADR